MVHFSVLKKLALVLAVDPKASALIHIKQELIENVVNDEASSNADSFAHEKVNSNLESPKESEHLNTNRLPIESVSTSDSDDDENTTGSDTSYSSSSATSTSNSDSSGTDTSSDGSSDSESESESTTSSSDARQKTASQKLDESNRASDLETIVETNEQKNVQESSLFKEEITLNASTSPNEVANVKTNEMDITN